MKQIIFKKGEPLITEVSIPDIDPDSIIIQVKASCISAGTELSVMDGTKDSLLTRAIKQPKNIIKAVEIAKKDGLTKIINLKSLCS